MKKGINFRYANEYFVENCAFLTRKNSSNQSSNSDIPGPLSKLTHLHGRSLRRNSISLPSGLNTIDIEAIQRAHIDDKISDSVSSCFLNLLLQTYNQE